MDHLSWRKRVLLIAHLQLFYIRRKKSLSHRKEKKGEEKVYHSIILGKRINITFASREYKSSIKMLLSLYVRHDVLLPYLSLKKKKLLLLKNHAFEIV